MELEFILCAESTVVDAATRKLTIQNVIEEVTTVGFPAVMPPLTVVALISRKKKSEPRKPKLSIRAELNGNQIFEIPIVPDFQGKLRNRVMAAFQGIVISGPGKLTMSLLEKKRIVGTCRIDITDIRQRHAIAAPTPIMIASSTTTGKNPARGQVQKRRKS